MGPSWRSSSSRTRERGDCSTVVLPPPRCDGWVCRAQLLDQPQLSLPAAASRAGLASQSGLTKRGCRGSLVPHALTSQHLKWFSGTTSPMALMPRGLCDSPRRSSSAQYSLPLLLPQLSLFLRKHPVATTMSGNACGPCPTAVLVAEEAWALPDCVRAAFTPTPSEASQFVMFKFKIRKQILEEEGVFLKGNISKLASD